MTTTPTPTPLEERMARLEAAYEHLATKSDITELRGEMKADIAELRNEMQAGNAELRGEMKADNAALRGEMKADNAELRGEMQAGNAALRNEMKADNAVLRTEMANMRAYFAERENRMIRWMVSLTLGAVVAVSTLTIIISRLLP